MCNSKFQGKKGKTKSGDLRGKWKMKIEKLALKHTLPFSGINKEGDEIWLSWKKGENEIEWKWFMKFGYFERRGKMKLNENDSAIKSG